MTEEKQGRRLKDKRLWQALALLAALLAILIVPPLVSVSRYKSRITQLISTSLGRPVRLSSVEVRLLPSPGFVLTDLSVQEDPAFGAEPLLHANTVTASIRLLSLWRGRLEIGTISVDEASLNLVRTPAGRWNIDSLFRNATARAQTGRGSPLGSSVQMPNLEATSSRINIKNGTEKLPFSLVNADLSFSQPNPGEWRLRLRAQPARTDLSLDLADMGVVRLDASAGQGTQLRQMPLHLDLEWRQAQLGQLTRLLLGTDAGWRGDLTVELHLDGTAESAEIKTRLRATGVHREEFAPAAPMDFDANCSLLSHFTSRAVENLTCDSPLGNGRIRIAGGLPGDGGQPRLTAELDRVPVAAALDALRTVRSGLGPGLEAKGTASGRITYAPVKEPAAMQERSAHRVVSDRAKERLDQPGPLTGSITVEGFEVGGNGLTEPIRVPRLVLEPMLGDVARPAALAATVAVTAGGPIPLTVSAHLTLSGYQVEVRGQASIPRARALARAAGIPDAGALDSLAGDPLAVDLAAEGPWIPAQRLPFSADKPATDSLTGTVTLRNANWKADYLVNHVEVSQATLHVGPGELRWDPIAFGFGPVKGSATLTLPSGCKAPASCLPHFEIGFGALDAAVLQTAFLGAHEPGTLLSTLIDRLRPTASPAWPQLEGTLKAEWLVLGPVTLRDPKAAVHIVPDGAEIDGFEAGLFGGRIRGSGKFHAAANPKDKPSYTLEGQYEKLDAPAVGKLLGMRWSGGPIHGDGKLELSGFSGSDLADSAKGAIHFAWPHGAASGAFGAPLVLSRFDRWVADAEIGDGAVTLKQNQVRRGSTVTPVQGTVTLADPPKVSFTIPRQAAAKR